SIPKMIFPRALAHALIMAKIPRTMVRRAERGGSRMRVIKSLLALSCSISLIGQASAAGLGKGEGEVDIVAWPGYIERGESDKNYDWVTDFEKKTGCKVNVKTAATSDEMVTLMNQGGFDLVTASGDASLRLVAGKKVQPINVDLIPSWK